MVFKIILLLFLISFFDTAKVDSFSLSAKFLKGFYVKYVRRQLIFPKKFAISKINL